MGVALVKSSQIMQTGSQILTEVGHTARIKKQPAKWSAHIEEMPHKTNNGAPTCLGCVKECIFWILLHANYNMTAALQMQIPDHTIPSWNMAPVSWHKDL